MNHMLEMCTSSSMGGLINYRFEGTKSGSSSLWLVVRETSVGDLYKREAIILNGKWRVSTQRARVCLLIRWCGSKVLPYCPMRASDWVRGQHQSVNRALTNYIRTELFTRRWNSFTIPYLKRRDIELSQSIISHLFNAPSKNFFFTNMIIEILWIHIILK